MKQTPQEKFKTFLETQLNPQQKKAVLANNGSILVIAGAGSGKTRVITARIINLLLEKHVLPHQLIALTFTNKAANEMKERIAHFLGTKKGLPFIGTFHSYCVRLLKEHAEYLDIPFFSIIDEDDQKKLINGILDRQNLKKQLSARTVAYAISEIKSKHIEPKKKAKDLFGHPLMYDVYLEYEKEKKESRCFDFDDLLLEAVKLFKKNRTFKKEFQAKLRHILVDEYQDTNVIQHELLKQMGTRNHKQIIDSICAVGDEDQSIYSWRGATIKNILNFQKDFENTKIIKIEQNYRSVQPILHLANSVISQNTQRNPKNLWSDRKATDRIKIMTFMSEYQEADAIATYITIAKKKYKRHDCAILYRTHAQSRAIEESLIRNSIPYKIIGGVQFYERKEIKDLLAYMRLIVNPFDRTAFFRIINVPARGLGKKFEQLFHEHWHNQPFLTYAQIIRQLCEQNIVKGVKAQSLATFVEIFNELQPHSKPSTALEKIIERSCYLAHLKHAYEKQEAQVRIDNIKELLTAIKHFEAHDIDSVETFLHEVALMQEKIASSDQETDKVLLMTLHAAKGLEFDTVMLAGLEQGILPTSRALDSENDNAFEEERRLFYVGITRAKERLILSHAKYRYTYGQMVDQFPSQFLDEVPNEVSAHEECGYWNISQLQNFFSSWLGFRSEKTIRTFGTARKDSPIKQKIKQTGTFKKNQPVKHKKYGTGIVQKVEKKDHNTWYVTVKFKSGLKKIIDRFLQSV